MGFNRYFKTKKVEFEGIKFDSGPEVDAYRILREAEKRGLISDLKLKEVFTLIPRQTEAVEVKLKTKTKIVEKFCEHPLTYESDFTYTKDGKRIVLDVKGNYITEDYTIRRKIMRWQGNPITECRNPYELFPEIAAGLGIAPVKQKKKSSKKKEKKKDEAPGLFE